MTHAPSPPSPPRSRPRRLVVFAHWDAQNVVRPYIVHYLSALREACDEIVFVSTSTLSPSEIAKVSPFCSATFLRDNVGYDFGMWKHALDHVDRSGFDEVVLTNSSVFGPLRPLGPIFATMSATDCDLWGMTLNREIAWHLQSYFLVFKRRLHQSEAFEQFWASVLPYKDKDQLIRAYEVGLSVFMRDQGFTLLPFVPPSKLPGYRWYGKPRALRYNPTTRFPVALLALGMPFVKIELLRENPFAIALTPVKIAMRLAGYDMRLVEFDRPVKRKIPRPWVP